MASSAEIDWNFWRQRKEVTLWEACLLSLNINPEAAKPDPASWMGGAGGDTIFMSSTFPSEEVRSAYKKRLILLKDHRADPDHFTPSRVPDASNRQPVSLAEFAAWAVQMRFDDLPEPLAIIGKTPRLSRLGIRPDPAAFAAVNQGLVRARAEPAARGLGNRPPADWSLWADIPKAQLWQAVALSIDIDPGRPGSAPLTVQAIERGRGGEMFGPEFDRRMTIAQQNLSAEGPLAPLELYPGVLGSPKAVVSLAAFRRFGESKGWDLPDKFPAAASSLMKTKTRQENAAAAPRAGAGADEPAKEFTTRERENMLRVILGLARAGYGYDPNQKKNSAVTEMVSDLERMGIAITDDTLRKYLKDASKLS